jgi:hypothetical protein
MIGLPIDEVSDLIAKAAVEVADLLGPDAWAKIPIALAGEAWVTPALQHELRPHVWAIRRRLQKYIATNGRLTDAQIHAAALEIAAEILPGGK